MEDKIMKYVLNGMRNTKAGILIIFEIIIRFVSLVINAEILRWIANSVSATTMPDAMYYIKLIIIGCVINTLLDIATGYTGLSRHILFTYMNNTFADKVLDGDVAMFSKYSPGVINHTGSKIYQIANMVRLLLSMLYNIITMLVNIVAIVRLAPTQIVPIGIAYLISGFILSRIHKKWYKLDEEVDILKRERNVELDEITNGFMEARSFGGTIESHRSTIHEQNRGIISKFKTRQIYTGALNGVVAACDTGAMLIVLMYAIMGNMSGNGIGSATSLALVMYVWRLAEPFVSFIFSFSDVSELRAILPKFNEIMAYENDIVDGDIELDCFNNQIEIRHLKFSYDKTSTILDDINMIIKKGSHIGICGKTGGGKSTFLKLLPRFYNVDSGGIYIDGVDIANLKINTLRSHMGIVHQSPYIFDGTLRENIAYGMRPKKVSDLLIQNACEKASVWDFIKNLPEGLDTKVGPRGMKLSGGQKQRISLARIFLTNPDIIILDEATSALDNDTEAAVQDAINLFKDKTIITVAHRLSTIRDCDAIYVIDNHHIVEAGTHDELMQMNGLYASMQK